MVTSPVPYKSDCGENHGSDACALRRRFCVCVGACVCGGLLCGRSRGVCSTGADAGETLYLECGWVGGAGADGGGMA